jgi:hypothetical protein
MAWLVENRVDLDGRRHQLIDRGTVGRNLVSMEHRWIRVENERYVGA